MFDDPCLSVHTNGTGMVCAETDSVNCWARRMALYGSLAFSIDMSPHFNPDIFLWAGHISFSGFISYITPLNNITKGRPSAASSLGK